MSKLESEYDYETDQDHIRNGTKVLTTDLFYAVDFFVAENPILFVENFERKFWKLMFVGIWLLNQSQYTYDIFS